MKNFEKLLMIIIPSTGLAVIFYFFSLYAPAIENGHFNDHQRLQGKPNSTASAEDSPLISPFKSIIERPKSKETESYIKYKSDKTITYITKNTARQISKNRTQISHQSIVQYPDAETLFQQDLQKQRLQKQAYQNRLHENKIRIKTRKSNTGNNDHQCNYIRKMKKLAEDRMKKRYKASQYRYLENNRKHWAKKYANYCFN